MTYVREIFDMDLFRQMVDEKMVTVRRHDDFPIVIANYSDQAQFKNCWNEVTLNCRGLIFDESGTDSPLFGGIVRARPWKKFFNLGDSKAPHIGFGDLAEVTDKMDGSLGIMYGGMGNPRIATRGSFHSTQAAWATKYLRTIPGLDNSAPQLYTFLFEIIYPTNRIVVDYGAFEGLVLLGCVEIATGYAFGPAAAAALLDWPGLTTEVMPYKSINDVLDAPDRENTEGYIIRRGNDMVKWKRPDYVELHRLISSLSEKSVWGGLAGGKSAEELIEGLPDEFHGFVRETSAKFLAAYDSRVSELYFKYSDLINAIFEWDGTGFKMDRKAFALAVRNDPDKAYMFAMLDAKAIGPMIWQELKPKGENNRE